MEEARGSQVQGHAWLHSEVKDGLGYMKLSLSLFKSLCGERVPVGSERKGERDTVDLCTRQDGGVSLLLGLLA